MFHTNTNPSLMHASQMASDDLKVAMGLRRFPICAYAVPASEGTEFLTIPSMIIKHDWDPAPDKDETKFVFPTVRQLEPQEGNQRPKLAFETSIDGKQVALPINVKDIVVATWRSIYYEDATPCIIDSTPASVFVFLCKNEHVGEYRKYIICRAGNPQLLTLTLSVCEYRCARLQSRQPFANQLWFGAGTDTERGAGEGVASAVLDMGAILSLSEPGGYTDGPVDVVIDGKGAIDIVIRQTINPEPDSYQSRMPLYRWAEKSRCICTRFAFLVNEASGTRKIRYKLAEQYDLDLKPRIVRGLVRHLTRDVVHEVAELLIHYSEACL